MKILITGICGFVGSSLAKAWLAADSSALVYGLDNFIRPGSEINRSLLQKSAVKLFHGDIRAASDFETLPAVDWVIDAAANPSVLAGIDGLTSSRQLIEHNLAGTINILEYCKKHGAGFIMLSTSRVYSIAQLTSLTYESVEQAFSLGKQQTLPPGISSEGIGEEFSTSSPVSLYGSTKLASEVLALEYGDTFSFPVWINRCGVMAGAGQFGTANQGIFAYWINAYLRRKALKYTGFAGSGFQVRDCLHPCDLASLLEKQINSPSEKKVRIVNIGGGKNQAISLAQLSAWCADRFGFHAVESCPETRRFDIPWSIMDSRLAEKIWHWRPKISLDQILDEIALHAQQHPNWLEISGV